MKASSTPSKHFLWGVATSAHQVNGNCYDDWSEWELKNAHRLVTKNSDLKRFDTESDIFDTTSKPENYISGKACNHWELYKEDFELLKTLGCNAYRFSFDWARIEPKEGFFDPVVIQHYQEMLKDLKQKNITPFATLWHWTTPIWFSNKGGWLNKRSLFYFQRFTEKIVDCFGTEIKFWTPLNEPIVYATQSYLVGRWPPQKINPFSWFKVKNRLILAHQISYKTIKAKFPNSQVGIAHNMVHLEPYRNLFINRVINSFCDHYINKRFLQKNKKYLDFIGVNYYFSILHHFGKIKKTGRPESDINWELHPEGLYHILCTLREYHIPIYITEHGLADHNDTQRSWYIRESLHSMEKAILEGIDVRGYFHWSFLDNFEWHKGFWPRFGLVEIDYHTLQRKPRSSFYSYKKIIKNSNL